LTPKEAYAIDSGVEHLAFDFSQFAILDTIGRPDLKLSNTTPSPSSVGAGGSVNVNYSLTNAGAAPSPSVVTTIRLTPIHSTPGAPVDLVPTSQAPSAGQIYPLDNRTESVVVQIPTLAAPGSYLISVIVSTAGGLPENASTLADNTQTRELTVTAGLGFRKANPIGRVP
jgi:hypothetical protein